MHVYVQAHGGRRRSASCSPGAIHPGGMCLRQGPSLGTGALQFGSADQTGSFRWLPLSAPVYKGIASVLLHPQLFIGMLLIGLGSVVSLSLSH